MTMDMNALIAMSACHGEAPRRSVCGMACPDQGGYQAISAAGDKGRLARPFHGLRRVERSTLKNDGKPPRTRVCSRSVPVFKWVERC